jgi:hypothetical protein
MDGASSLTRGQVHVGLTTELMALWEKFDVNRDEQMYVVDLRMNARFTPAS